MRTKKTTLTKKMNQSNNSKLYPISCLGFLLGFNMALVLNPSQALALEIGYSGRLQEESGKTVDGPLDFTVKFYNDPSGGNTVGPVLNLSNTELRDGVFQLSLNFDNGQLAAIFGDGSKAAFVEVEAGGKVYPRQRLIAVPLALRVPVDTSTLNYTNDGKLTVESVDMSKISGLTAALAAKADSSTVTSSSVKMTNNLSDLSSPSAARTNLGLGSLATASSVTSSMIASNTILDSNISSSAAIADTKLATISTAGKVSGSAITSGTIGGTTAFNSSGAITTSGAVTASGAITGTGNFVVNGTGTGTTELRFNDDDNSAYVGFKSPSAVTTTRIWTLPAADGTAGQFLRTDGAGILSWLSIAGGGDMLAANNLSDLANAGTARTNLGLGTLATNSAVTSALITNDTIVDADINASAAIADTKLATISTAGKVSGSAITSGTIGGSTVVTTTGQVSSSGNIRVAGTGVTATDLRFGDNDDSHYVGFKAPGTVGTNLVWTLPATDGTANQALSTNASGVLQWVTPMLASDNLTGLGNVATARTNLGLGTLATNSAVTSALITDDTIVDADINASAAIADTKLATISTAGKVSGSAITSGTIAGSTIFNTTGAVTTTAAITGQNIIVNGTGAATTELRFNDDNNSNYVGFKSPATVSTNRIWTLPAADGTNGQVLKTDGSGALSWVSAAGAGGDLLSSNNLSDLANAGTARTNLGLGTLATNSAVTSALITDDTIVDADINASAAIVDTKLATISTAGKVSGSAITSGTIGGSTIVATSGQLSSTGNIRVAGTGVTATDLRFGDNDDSHYVGFKSPATVTTNLVWTLPAADGTANQALSTNASGVLQWVTPLLASSNLSDLANAGTARTNLGLGSLATSSAVGSSEITNDSIMNADINTSAAIATSKLSGAVTSIASHGLGSLATLSAVGSSEITNDSIMNTDINTSAAIATSKLSGAVTSIASHGLGSLATLSAVGSSEITNDSIMDTDINSAAAIADTKLATISTAGKVSGSAITSGTIAGSTIFNTTGAVTTTAAITGQNVIVNSTGAAATELRFNDDNNSNYVGFKSPSAVGTNLVWTLPAADGSANQALSTNASGVLQWVTPLLASNNLSDLANAGTARTNLGLGSLATSSAVGSSEITNDSIMNTDINTSAAIATSKLSGAVTSIASHGLGSLATLSAVGSSEITNDSIMNTDINTSAAIATSKLSGAVTSIASHGLGSLATLSAVGSSEITNDSIMNTDINASAAIADTKLATISTAGKVSGSAITSGTIAGTTAINSSGAITTTGAITGKTFVTPPATTLTPSGTAQTIDFSTSNVQTLDLSSATGTVTLTFSNPVAGGVYTVIVDQGATPRAITWPGTVLWENATAPTLSGANKIDLITFLWNGTNYFGVSSLTF